MRITCVYIIKYYSFLKIKVILDNFDHIIVKSYYKLKVNNVKGCKIQFG